MLGAAISHGIGCNDQSYSLSSGTYALCKSNKEINTVSITQKQYPFLYEKIDVKYGETIFLYDDFGFGRHTLKTIDNDLGMTMVMDAQEKGLLYEDEYTEKSILKYDYGHQIALMNPYIVGIDILKHENSPNILEANKSRIIFFRHEDNLQRATIWSKDSLLGSLGNDGYLVVDVEPGLHSFFTKYAAWGILDVKAKAGETYYIDVDNIWGWNEVYTKLKPTKDIPDLSKFIRVSIDKSKITPLIQKRLDAALLYIKEISKDRGSSKIYSYSKID